MNGFLYYLEGAEGKPDFLSLEAAGLGAVFSGEVVDFRHVMRGPGGAGRGVLVWARGSQDRLPGVQEGAQVWEEMPGVFLGGAGAGTSTDEHGPTRTGADGGEEEHPPPFGHPLQRGTKPEEGAGQEHGAPGVGEEAADTAALPGHGAPVGRVLVGYWKGALPGPLDLVRGRVLAGHEVRLGDGRLWLVPMARRYEAGPEGILMGRRCLPERAALNRRLGIWEPGGIEERYRELWRIAETWREALEAAARESWDEADEGVISLTFDDLFECATRALMVNYRLGPMECALLGLWTQEAAVGVLNAVNDEPGFRKLLAKKKRALRGAGISGGGPG